MAAAAPTQPKTTGALSRVTPSSSELMEALDKIPLFAHLTHHAKKSLFDFFLSLLEIPVDMRARALLGLVSYTQAHVCGIVRHRRVLGHTTASQKQTETELEAAIAAVTPVEGDAARREIDITAADAARVVEGQQVLSVVEDTALEFAHMLRDPPTMQRFAGMWAMPSLATVHAAVANPATEEEFRMSACNAFQSVVAALESLEFDSSMAERVVRAQTEGKLADPVPAVLRLSRLTQNGAAWNCRALRTLITARFIETIVPNAPFDRRVAAIRATLEWVDHKLSRDAVLYVAMRLLPSLEASVSAALSASAENGKKIVNAESVVSEQFVAVFVPAFFEGEDNVAIGESDLSGCISPDVTPANRFPRTTQSFTLVKMMWDLATARAPGHDDDLGTDVPETVTAMSNPSGNIAIQEMERVLLVREAPRITKERTRLPEDDEKAKEMIEEQKKSPKTTDFKDPVRGATQTLGMATFLCDLARIVVPYAGHVYGAVLDKLARRMLQLWRHAITLKESRIIEHVASKAVEMALIRLVHPNTSTRFDELLLQDNQSIAEVLQNGMLGELLANAVRLPGFTIYRPGDANCATAKIAAVVGAAITHVNAVITLSLSSFATPSADPKIMEQAEKDPAWYMNEVERALAAVISVACAKLTMEQTLAEYDRTQAAALQERDARRLALNEFLALASGSGSTETPMLMGRRIKRTPNKALVAARQGQSAIERRRAGEVNSGNVATLEGRDVVAMLDGGDGGSRLVRRSTTANTADMLNISGMLDMIRDVSAQDLCVAARELETQAMLVVQLVKFGQTYLSNMVGRWAATIIRDKSLGTVSRILSSAHGELRETLAAYGLDVMGERLMPMHMAEKKDDAAPEPEPDREKEIAMNARNAVELVDAISHIAVPVVEDMVYFSMKLLGSTVESLSGNTGRENMEVLHIRKQATAAAMDHVVRQLWPWADWKRNEALRKTEEEKQAQEKEKLASASAPTTEREALKAKTFPRPKRLLIVVSLDSLHARIEEHVSQSVSFTLAEQRRAMNFMFHGEAGSHPMGILLCVPWDTRGTESKARGNTADWVLKNITSAYSELKSRIGYTAGDEGPDTQILLLSDSAVALDYHEELLGKIRTGVGERFSTISKGSVSVVGSVSLAFDQVVLMPTSLMDPNATDADMLVACMHIFSTVRSPANVDEVMRMCMRMRPKEEETITPRGLSVSLLNCVINGLPDPSKLHPYEHEPLKVIRGFSEAERPTEDLLYLNGVVLIDVPLNYVEKHMVLKRSVPTTWFVVYHENTFPHVHSAKARTKENPKKWAEFSPDKRLEVLKKRREACIESCQHPAAVSVLDVGKGSGRTSSHCYHVHNVVMPLLFGELV